MEDGFYAINESGTVVYLSERDFTERFEPAGYHRLGEHDAAPIQQFEVQMTGEDGPDAILRARVEEHGHARYPMTPEAALAGWGR